MNIDAVLDLLAEEPDPSLDLAEVALCLACDEYPDLDVEAYLGELAAMAHDAEQYVRGPLEARVHGLCRYLFHDLGFRGNVDRYYDPRNSYLNEVLDRRTGLPITLSAVAIAVGTRVGLNLCGVGLPGHFIVKAIGTGGEVLFDPFHGGRRLSAEGCEILVEQVTGEAFQATPQSLAGVTPRTFLTRILTNLKGSYLRDGDYARAARIIRRLRQIHPHDLLQVRDLGVTLFHAGQPGKAINLLQEYLKIRPEAEDGVEVREMLSKAKSQIAVWN